MSLPLGVRPEIDAERRKGFDVRRAIERRFGADLNAEGEGRVTAEVADKFVTAVREGDKVALDIATRAIHEINGPPRQGIDVSAKVYSIVRIVGDEDDEDEEGE